MINRLNRSKDQKLNPTRLVPIQTGLSQANVGQIDGLGHILPALSTAKRVFALDCNIVEMKKDKKGNKNAIKRYY